MFENGTVVEQAFKGPVREDGRRVWRTQKKLTAQVVDCATNIESRRHQYKLSWFGSDTDLVLAGVEEIVDESYVEQYRIES
ncbi:unnamed protein product [Ectocarpus sp. 13 AM-2016]